MNDFTRRGLVDNIRHRTYRLDLAPSLPCVLWMIDD